MSSMACAMRRVALTVGVALAAASLWLQRDANAAEPARAATPSRAPRAEVRDSGVRWPNNRFVYKAEGKRLTDVLLDFAASQGYAAVIADGVEGMVQASFDATPNEFLSAMSKAYGLIWYFDGAGIYFYPSKAIQSRIFRLRGYSGEQVNNLLSSLQLSDRRFPLRYNRTEQTLLVYGPPRHVELVSAAIESLDAGAGENDQPVTRVFHLRYGWAADRKFGSQTVPGVATTLRGLYRSFGSGSGAGEDGQQSQVASSEAFVKKAATITRMYGVDKLSPQIPSAANGPSGMAEKSLTGSGPRGVRSPLDGADDAPQFQPDEATNAILVRGRRSRMAEYGDIIRRLDVKPTLIELEAMIIDVSSDSVDSLGIAWSARGQHGSLAVEPPNTSATASSGNTTGAFAITTLWQNAGRELLARISALEANGKARVVAKPRVLGVANRPALMQEKRIANVRVAGNLDTSLYQVEAGTELQVTPQVTYYDTQCRLKLSIYIVDGKFEDAQVDQVPVVKHTEILTEAHMTEGESLLIGGISVETDTSRKSGVPGLQRVPLIGGLFRWQETQKNRSERLFLITPRVVRETVIAAAPQQQQQQAAAQGAASSALAAPVPAEPVPQPAVRAGEPRPPASGRNADGYLPG